MIRLRRVLRAIGLAGLIALTLTQLAEIAAAELVEARHADPAALPRVNAILVLGAGMDPDGGIAWSSRRRVVAAVAALKAGRADHLILSGFSRDPRFAPAAEGMRDHALALGAPAASLTVEPLAATTLENLRLGYAIADANGWRCERIDPRARPRALARPGPRAPRRGRRMDHPPA